MDENQRILEEWTIGFVLPMLKPEGIYMVPDPAPLSTEEVVAALEAVRDSSAYYEGQTVIVPDRDGVLVQLRAGEIEIGGK